MTLEPADAARLRQARVLVVEDDPVGADLLAMILGRAGAEVSVATTATQAIRLVADGLLPAVVLLDLNLPDLPGMQLAKVLRALDDTRGVPIVVVSGAAIAFGEQAALLSGCDGFISKPIDVDTFPALVADYLRPTWTRSAPAPACPARPVLGHHYQAVLDAIPKAVCVVRPDDLTMVYGNRRFEQLSGYTMPGLVGLPIAIAVPDGGPGVPAMRELIRARLDAGGDATFEVPRLRPDRTTFWVESTIARLEDAELGEVWLLVFDDVSRRRRSEDDLKRALARSETRFTSLWDAGILAIAVGELVSGRLVDANDRFLELIGRTRADVMAGRVSRRDFSPPEFDAKDQAAAEVVGERGYVPPWEKDYVRPDGTRVPVLVGGAALDATTYVSYAIDLSDKRRNEVALQESHRRFDALWRSGLIGIVISDDDGVLREANDGYLAIIGYSRAELEAGLINYVQIIPPEHREAAGRAAQQMASRGVTDPWQTEVLRKDGTRVPLMAGVATLDARHSIGIVVDLSARRETERQLRRTEDQLRQAQKMEAVGRLAGGVAHDFNNLLTVILSYSEMLLEDPDDRATLVLGLKEIHKAATRASELTKQLLVFSRQQLIEPGVVNLNEVVVGMDRMLRRLLGEDIELTMRPGAAIGSVTGAPSHLEQVIVNLAVNARDAMPEGGAITIETANVDVDEADARAHAPVTAGRYVLLAVSDDGCGMDRETQARIFEPFFTTKPVGQGTGLGLSIVFGIVHQCGGHISVYSEPGQGTTFKIYLPRVDAAADRPKRATLTARVGGTETILLVEDEDQVRRVAHDILRRCGYHVLEARSPTVAVQLCDEHPGNIDLLITDVVMPQLSGPELARRLLLARPTMRVLCMSGYTDGSVTRHKLVEQGVAFIQKPLTPDSLSRKVREVLDAAPHSPPGDS